MSPEAQRIAIAEACGWKEGASRTSPPMPELGLIRQWHDPKTNFLTPNLPDYLNDLNAMHEAEKVLYKSPAKWRRYRQQLNWLPDYGVRATAAQRAEAFLKTIGKWEE